MEDAQKSSGAALFGTAGYISENILFILLLESQMLFPGIQRSSKTNRDRQQNFCSVIDVYS